VARVPLAGLGGIRRRDHPGRRRARRWHGALIAVNPHVERVPLELEGPRADAFGVLASALLPAFFQHRERGGHVVRAFHERMRILAVAEALLEARAPERAAAGVALPDALPDLWRSLETTS
jgi:hypothetical protein